jgi:hypothetical protein
VWHRAHLFYSWGMISLDRVGADVGL